MTNKEKLDFLEREKAEKIEKYMALQDQADSLNEEIYKVCCTVETLNAEIQRVQEALRKEALKAAAAQNGKPPPPA
jgi:peptidoglycan hydrolase CwlO-like protein